jgi:hypothetical protein
MRFLEHDSTLSLSYGEMPLHSPITIRLVFAVTLSPTHSHSLDFKSVFVGETFFCLHEKYFCILGGTPICRQPTAGPGSQHVAQASTRNRVAVPLFQVAEIF